jgi:hypothetical protein
MSDFRFREIRSAGLNLLLEPNHPKSEIRYLKSSSLRL